MNSLSELKGKSKDNLVNIIRDLQLAFKQNQQKPKDWFIIRGAWKVGVFIFSVPKDFVKNHKLDKNKYYKIYLEEIK